MSGSEEGLDEDDVQDGVQDGIEDFDPDWDEGTGVEEECDDDWMDEPHWHHGLFNEEVFSELFEMLSSNRCYVERVDLSRRNPTPEQLYGLGAALRNNTVL